VLGVDPGADFEAGVPLPRVLISLLVEIDVEVNPFALRREFEFFIAADVLEVGANEGLGDVPVPEPIGLRRCVGRGFQIELFVGRSEEEIEAVLGPTGADLGAMGGNGRAIRVASDEDGLGLLPEGGRGIWSERNVVIRLVDVGEGTGMFCAKVIAMSGAKTRGRRSRADMPSIFSSASHPRNWIQAMIGDTMARSHARGCSNGMSGARRWPRTISAAAQMTSQGRARIIAIILGLGECP
jgi:hypothetical protein